MKAMISLALVLSSTTLWAAPQTPSCPSDSEVIHECYATPQAGDSEFAGSFTQGISICKSGFKYLMALTDTEGATQTGEVNAVIRVGGSQFSISQDGVDLKFSLVSGTFEPITTAKLFVQVKEAMARGSTTFTCK